VSGNGDRRPDWLRWAQRIQAIAQAGLTYARDPFDRERYEELRGIAVEMAARQLEAPPADVRVAFASSLGYPTPKVDVRAVVFRGGELLLVRERRNGRWTFPGGWADAGDTPSLAAERETLEEVALDLRAARPLGELSDVLGHAESIRVSAFVYGIDGEPDLRPNYEVGELFWSPLAHLADPSRQAPREFSYLEHSMSLPTVRLLEDERAPVLWGITYKFMDDFMQRIGRPIPTMPWEENDV